MKKTSKLFISFLMSLSLLAGSVTFLHEQKVNEVVAATNNQHLDNFDTYYYSGSYYDSIPSGEGMNGALRTALTSKIYPAAFYEYSGGLSTHLQQADEDPSKKNNMILLYTRNSIVKQSSGTWNREHVWPKNLSNGCWNESKAGTDILHLRPTYPTTNSTRSNDKYGDVPNASTLIYEGMEYGRHSGGVFEPLDTVKGDVARICMYVWVAYYNEYGSSLPALTKVFTSFDTLMKWHISDLPDEMEGHRNDYSESSNQKNRNPFVDHPEYAWMIFGSECSSTVLNSAKETYPESGLVPTDPVPLEDIKIAETKLDLAQGESKYLTVTYTPSNATNKKLKWTSTDDSVASVSSGYVTANKEGSATITATSVDGGFTASCLVNVTGTDFGSLDDPLDTTEARNLIDKITQSGSFTTEEMYVIGKATSVSYSDEYKNYQISLSNPEGTNNNYFQFYATSVDPSLGDVAPKVGDVLIAKGHGKLHANTTYELAHMSIGEGKYTYPTILAINPGTEEKVLTGIRVSDVNNRVKINETYMFKGKVFAEYSNGTSKQVSGYIVSTLDTSSVGVKPVTVSYTEKEVTKQTSFDVTVYEGEVVITLTDIRVTNINNTVKQNQTYVFNGTVTAVYSDDSFRDVTSYSITPVDTSSLGEKDVTISYTEDNITKDFAFTVTVIENEPPVVDIYITSIYFEKDSYTLDVGSKLDLTFDYKPDDATKFDFVWASDNDEVATVDDFGLVTAIKSGEAEITIIDTFTSKMATVKIIVKGSGCGGNITATSIVLSSISLLLVVFISIRKKIKEE